MFVRSKTDSRVVVIVDVTHLFYKMAYGGMPRLTSTLRVDGVLQEVETGLPSGVIKNLHRWSNCGINPLVVCFDSAGCSRSRKAYFASKLGIKTGGEAVGYKSTRDTGNTRLYEGINLTMRLLQNGGVTCLKSDMYEADDLVKAAVDKAKETYPDLPIHVVTGDADLVPLVDEQVSVFLTSKVTSKAEEPQWLKNGYVQITPENYQAEMERRSAYKNLKVPYNTLLLAKCLRGDKSDDIAGYPKFTPTKYKALLEQLESDGYDLATLCKYDAPVCTICYKDTEKPIPTELIDSVPKENKIMVFSEPKTCTRLCKILSNYLDEDIVAHVRFIYNGINLNGAFTNLPVQFMRKPANMCVPVQGYNAAKLQQAVSVVQIHLPMV